MHTGLEIGAATSEHSSGFFLQACGDDGNILAGVSLDGTVISQAGKENQAAEMIMSRIELLASTKHFRMQMNLFHLANGVPLSTPEHFLTLISPNSGEKFADITWEGRVVIQKAFGEPNAIQRFYESLSLQVKKRQGLMSILRSQIVENYVTA